MNNVTLDQPLPYPKDRFHQLVYNVALEIERNVQAADALVGMVLLAAMAAVCQGLVDVMLPMGQIRPVSLFLLLIAESGDRKSTVDKLVFSALHRKDLEAATIQQRLWEDYIAALEVWKVIRQRLRRRLTRALDSGHGIDAARDQLAEHVRSKPKTPKIRRLIHQDVTARALIDQLEGEGVSMMVSTDEGQVVLRSEAMYHLGLLNKAWDGAPLSIDRAGMEHVPVNDPRVTVNIMTQHVILEDFIRRQGNIAKGSGHWARYLVGWPESKQGYRYVCSEEMEWVHLPKLQARMRELLDKYAAMVEIGQIRREVLTFSDEAKVRWNQIAWETEFKLRPGDILNDVNEFGAKIMEIVGRVSAVLHYFNGEVGPITVDTLERAIAIVVWHVNEHKRLFSPAHRPTQAQLDAKKLLEWFRNNQVMVMKEGGRVAKNYLRRHVIYDSGRLNKALEIWEKTNCLLRWRDPKNNQWWVYQQASLPIHLV